MRYIVEDNLSDFPFWSGARERAEMLTDEQLDKLEPYVQEMIGECPTDTEINDLFWFEFDTLLENLGLVDCGDCVKEREEWAKDEIEKAFPADCYLFDDFWEENKNSFFEDEDELLGDFQAYVNDLKEQENE